jgi:hypothetical protein
MMWLFPCEFRGQPGLFGLIQNTGGGSRTHTPLPRERILSPQRLPFRHAGCGQPRKVPGSLPESNRRRGGHEFPLRRRLVADHSGPRSGGGGIRTHGLAEPVNGFQDRPDQPLWHPSESRESAAGTERSATAGRGVSLADLVNDVLSHVDRHIHGHRQRNRVAGPRIDLDELSVMADSQLREIGVLAQLVDVNILQLAS